MGSGKFVTRLSFQGSEFTALFNYHLIRMDEAGLLDKIRRNYTYVASEDFGLAGADPLGFDTASFPFLTLLLFIPLSLIVTIFEVLCCRGIRRK